MDERTAANAQGGDPSVRPRSPVLGYNHNVRYRGRIYHVQTEDSGVASAHVDTHLFVGGTIVASLRTTYRADEPEVAVQKRMQAQHKGILRDLKGGLLDANIERLFGSLEGDEPPVEAARGERTQPPRPAAAIAPRAPHSRPPTGPRSAPPIPSFGHDTRAAVGSAGGPPEAAHFATSQLPPPLADEAGWAGYWQERPQEDLSPAVRPLPAPPSMAPPHPAEQAAGSPPPSAHEPHHGLTEQLPHPTWLPREASARAAMVPRRSHETVRRVSAVAPPANSGGPTAPPARPAGDNGVVIARPVIVVGGAPPPVARPTPPRQGAPVSGPPAVAHNAQPPPVARPGSGRYAASPQGPQQRGQSGAAAPPTPRPPPRPPQGARPHPGPPQSHPTARRPSPPTERGFGERSMPPMPRTDPPTSVDELVLAFLDNTAGKK